MSDPRAMELMKRYEGMSSRRSVFESHWQQVARRFLPTHDDFQTIRTPGSKRSEWVFDSTAALALERFAAAMDSLITPRSGKPWHNLKASTEELQDDQSVKVYLEQVNKILWQARYSPKANFAAQAAEFYLMLGAFGTGPMLIEEEIGQGLRYKTCHLSEIYIEENAWGRVDTVARKFQMSARQASQRFRNLPEKIAQAVEKEPDKAFDFIHFVMPSEDRDTERRDWRGMPWSSEYISCEGKQTVQRGGFNTFPYAIGRDITSPREVYGRSRAMTALADAKMQNEMAKTILTAAQKQVDPPLILSDEGSLAPFQTRPSAVNRGYISEDGKPLAQYLKHEGNIALGMEMLERTGEAINDALLNTIFQVLVDHPGQMTATEVLERAQEKGALLGPVVGRLQSEWLDPMIERELDILARAGQLPEMPEAMIEAGGTITIDYESPIMTAMRAEEGMGIIRTLEALVPVAQVDPSVMKRIKMDEIPAKLGEAFGMPSGLIRTDEEMEALLQQEAVQAGLAQMAEALPLVADATDKLAGADLKRAQAAAV